jgi:hypothetical protein
VETLDADDDVEHVSKPDQDEPPRDD